MNNIEEIKKQLQEKGWQNELFSSSNMHTLLMIKILQYLEGEVPLETVFNVTLAINKQKNVQIQKNLMLATEKILVLEKSIGKEEVAKNDTDSINNTFNNVLELLIE